MVCILEVGPTGPNTVGWIENRLSQRRAGRDVGKTSDTNGMSISHLDQGCGRHLGVARPIRYDLSSRSK
jgi:hypothetical protein